MSITQSIISFYRDCFEEENKGGGIANFLSAKVEHHQLIKGKEDHLSGLLPYTPISDKLGQRLQAEIALYEKYFLKGFRTGLNQSMNSFVSLLIIMNYQLMQFII